MKLKKIISNVCEGYVFLCEACNYKHVFYTKTGNKKTEWDFNGNVDSPTFLPSLKNSHPGDQKNGGNIPPHCCHLYLTNGVIKYEADCTHSMAGTSRPLKDMAGEPEATT